MRSIGSQDHDRRRARRHLVDLLAVVLLTPLSGWGHGDSYLSLGASGFALRADASVDDLDYERDFSVEAIIAIDPNQRGGHTPYIVAKADEWALFADTEPGFGLGLKQGHVPTYGQVIVAKIGDGMHHVVVEARQREGYAYAVMTWDVRDKILRLYVNGVDEGQAGNAQIRSRGIKTTFPLGLGHSQGYSPLARDIHLARLWNRRLSAEEVVLLWEYFSASGRHVLPVSFDRSALHSEWLMYETSDASGRPGTTHVKDSLGENHLRLSGGAAVERGLGPLRIDRPTDNAFAVDKSVYLTAVGGQDSLPGPCTLPLHYRFQVDESPAFNSPDLRSSKWIVHYGRWRPVLRPNRTYYWRAKVRDSSDPPKESAFTGTYTFRTEGASIWYVRPRSEKMVYGHEDGTSYDHAFNGLVNWDDDSGACPGIVWGPGGVEAGDTLYVCDVHELGQHSIYAEHRYFRIGESGHSAEHSIRIRGDHPDHPGLVKAGDDGYAVVVDRKKHVVFQGLTFEGFTLLTEPLDREGQDVCVTADPRSTYITFMDCHMTYGGDHFVELYTGHDHWTFLGNTIMYGGMGIHTLARGGTGAQFLTVEGNTIQHIGTPPFEHPDAHAVGGQSGAGHVVRGNYIEDVGDAIAFWTSTKPMRDVTICHNFIRNARSRSVAMGDGIVISGSNNDSFGMRTGFRVYGNIIVDAERAGISSNNKDVVGIYHNVICRCGVGLRFNLMDAPLTAVVHNNIIYDPVQDFVHVRADSDQPWPDVSWDHNLYYPHAAVRPAFRISILGSFTFSAYRRLLGWDAHALARHPLFVADHPVELEDFRLQATSPAVDAGLDVGIDMDIADAPVPYGPAPDIGAYEYYPEQWLRFHAGVLDAATVSAVRQSYGPHVACRDARDTSHVSKEGE